MSTSADEFHGPARLTFGLWRVDVPEDWEVVADARCCARLNEAPALSMVFDHDEVHAEASLESYIDKQRIMLGLTLGSEVELKVEGPSSKTNTRAEAVSVTGAVRALDGAMLNTSQLYVRRGKHVAVLTCMVVNETLESTRQILDAVLETVVLLDELDVADGSGVAYPQLVDSSRDEHPAQER